MLTTLTSHGFRGVGWFLISLVERSEGSNALDALLQVAADGCLFGVLGSDMRRRTPPHSARSFAVSCFCVSAPSKFGCKSN